MLKSLVLCAIVAAALARPQRGSLYLQEHQENIVAEINAMQTTWTAGVNMKFVNVTHQYIKGLMGTRLTGSPIELPVADIEVGAVPTSFDSRQQWGSICPSTNEIRDQADCGSCWAFGAVEAMTDRYCIASKGAKSPHFSAQDLLSCCGFSCGDGCNGGYPQAAWQWFKTTGCVTGGNYDSNEGCEPYSLANCDHHTTGQYQPCPSTIAPTPSCKKSCIPAYTNATYAKDKNFGASAYAVPASVDKIATEIMTNGPVEGSFTVFEDFLSYKSGVYQHTSGQELGGHAIKILGWGVLSNVDYWIVANSWNVDWGNQGYFLIRRGVDECGIESGIVAGLPRV